MRTRSVIAAIIAAALAVPANAQSLGDVARQQRKTKKPAARVFDNDSLAEIKAPLTTAEVHSTASAPDADKSQAKKPGAPSSSSDSLAATQTTYRSQIQEQRTAIAQLETELGKLERDAQVQATNYYVDAGNRLRDPRAWTEQRMKLAQQITEKHNQLTAAREKLDSLLEQARKLGIPSNALE